MAAPYPPPASAVAQVRPAAGWYAVVGVLWVAALALLGTVVATSVHLVSDGITPVPASRAVWVPAGGLTIYSSRRPPTRECSLTSPSGHPVTFSGMSFELNVSSGGSLVHAIASTPAGVAPGVYRVSCQGLVASDRLWTGDRLPLASIVVRSLLAVACGILGAVGLVVLIVTRHASRSRIRRQQWPGPPGYVAGWPGPPRE